MKRIFLIFVLLFASVLTTACINNFAIQELNNKAKAYLEAGEMEKAVCRYKSSLDLDSSIFETHYNLGVAYVNMKKYDDAIVQLKEAIKIDSQIADTYYSLAVANENLAYEKINPEVEEDGDDEKMSNVSIATKKFTEEEKEEITKLFMGSIDSYNQYLTHNPEAEDKDKVIAHVEELNKELLKYTTEENKED